MAITITKMTLNDLLDIKDILQTEFDDFWNVSTLEDELKYSTSYYIVAKSKPINSVVEASVATDSVVVDTENETIEKAEIVGFAGIKVVLDEADIMNIVVKKSKRNQGIGSILLENIISLSEKLNCKTISLEVNEENLSAIHLYEKFGFKKLGIRKNYYKDKNGIIMTK